MSNRRVKNYEMITDNNVQSTSMSADPIGFKVRRLCVCVCVVDTKMCYQPCSDHPKLNLKCQTDTKSG